MNRFSEPALRGSDVPEGDRGTGHDGLVSQRTRDPDGPDAIIRGPVPVTLAPVDHAHGFQRLADAARVVLFGGDLQLSLKHGERLWIVASEPMDLAHGPQRAGHAPPILRCPEPLLGTSQFLQRLIVVPQQLQHIGQGGLGLRQETSVAQCLGHRQRLPDDGLGPHPKSCHPPDLGQGQLDFACFCSRQAALELALQQAIVEADSLIIGINPLGRERCAAIEPDSLLRLAGLLVMGGDLAAERIEVIRGQRLERTGHAQMHAAPPDGTDLVVGDGANSVVGEIIRAEVLLTHELALPQLIQARLSLRCLQLAGPGQDVQAELAPDHRSGLCDRQCGRRQRRQAPPDHCTHLGREHRGGRGCCRIPPQASPRLAICLAWRFRITPLPCCPIRHACPGHLNDEQGVSF